MDDLITVEYWPNTAQWRILVAGVAVGYWSTDDEAALRARQALRALADQSLDHGATWPKPKRAGGEVER